MDLSLFWFRNEENPDGSKGVYKEHASTENMETYPEKVFRKSRLKKKECCNLVPKQDCVLNEK